MPIRIYSILLFCCFALTVFAQSPDHNPKFGPFYGTVYSIPSQYVAIGYGDYLQDELIIDSLAYRYLGLPRADFRQQEFPGLKGLRRFGIIFKSEVMIPTDGVYEFSLNSDDGSILWIGDTLVVYNDQPHPMRLRSGQISLSRGLYPVKVWYYQAHVPQWGLELSASYLGEILPEHEVAKFTLDETQLKFAFNSALLPNNAQAILKDVIEQLADWDVPITIHITGHCDNSGEAAYNQRLSEARATAVKEVIQQALPHKPFVYQVSGQGALVPIADNTTEAGRRQNRRVEIRIVQDHE